MTRRRPSGWYLGLVLLAVVPVAIAILVVWDASGQQLLVNDFYQSQSDQITEEEYRYWDSIQRYAYTMTIIAAPTLFTGAVAAILGLLAVLAFRWERKPRPGQDVAEATTAS